MKKDGRETDLYIKTHPKSPVSESFRFIRTNLNYMNPDKPLKVIGITSTLEQEGKSTVSANLAVALALDGEKTLAIDADLRKPMLNRFFKVMCEGGLSDYLANGTDYNYIIKSTEEHNLDLITTGNIPPNPAELLGSNKMHLLIKNLRKDYDKIIVDTAPIIPVSDTVSLAPYLDGIILVTAAKQTTIEMLKKTKNILDNVNANLLGTIINKYPVNSGGKHYQKKYYYYGENDK